MNDTLSGVVENVVYKNAETGYAVVEIITEGELVTVVGGLSEVSEGEEITAAGGFVNHPSFGVQFKATSYVSELPRNAGAIFRYLSSGVLPGIGPVTARRIVDAFGENTLDIINDDPATLSRVRGMSLSKANIASVEFKRIFGIREAMAYLAGYGIDAADALSLYRYFGQATINAVSENPFILCGSPLAYDFAKADIIADMFQIEKQSRMRIKAGFIFVLRHNLNNGHTCLPTAKLIEATCKFIEVEQLLIEEVLDIMLAEGDLVAQKFGETEYIFLPHLLVSEQFIAVKLKKMIGGAPREQAVTDDEIEAAGLATGITYAKLQRKAIKLALSCNVFVLTGGPGTGKTTAINAIISLLEARHERVGLAAPTGRAAKRMEELTGRKAKTIHRLLEVDYGGEKAENIKFIHNEANPLRLDTVVIDEMSMVDVNIFESLLKAIKPGCRLIMVGDANQLSSVGAGNVLSDITGSGIVEVVTLKEIFRQAAKSQIVVNAHRIVNGEQVDTADKTGDMFFIESRGTACRELVCELVKTRLPQSYGIDSFSDIQVLSPSRMGLLGTTQLNSWLQLALNPPAKNKRELSYMGQVFREGDKVMQVRNNYDISYTVVGGEDGMGAFNGDIGVVEQVDPRTYTVDVNFDGRRYSYDIEHLKELEIAYAVTVHKSQGSEFKAVVLPLYDVPTRLCYRNLLYTAVTRAKELLIVVGAKHVMNQMTANNRKTARYTGLKHYLLDEQLDW